MRRGESGKYEVAITGGESARAFFRPLCRHGLRRLREIFPLSNRLIREIHGVLMSSGQGSATVH